MKRRGVLAALLVIAVSIGLLLIIPTQSDALTWTFTKIADTSTPIPGASGNFESFGPSPPLDGDNIAFRGYDAPLPGGNQGIYQYIGGTINVVADSNTSLPGSPDKFIGFGPPSLSGGDVAFYGLDSGDGIYIVVGGTLDVVADNSTPVPDGSGNFSGFSGPSLYSGKVAFQGRISGIPGIYTGEAGTLAVVADTSTLIPGKSETFANLINASLFNDNLAFWGEDSSGQQGIYTYFAGTLDVLADTTTPIPGATGNFNGLDGVSLFDENVAFAGFGSSGHQGIYFAMGKNIYVVADTETLIPDGTGFFVSFSDPSLFDENVAFRGFGPSGQVGLYTNIDGILSAIIAKGDTLDSKTVLDLGMGLESLSGNSLAFWVQFSDGTEGIYRADLISITEQPIPEPATLFLLGSGLAGLGFVRRRREKM